MSTANTLMSLKRKIQYDPTSSSNPADGPGADLGSKSALKKTKKSTGQSSVLIKTVISKPDVTKMLKKLVAALRNDRDCLRWTLDRLLEGGTIRQDLGVASSPIECSVRCHEAASDVVLRVPASRALLAELEDNIFPLLKEIQIMEDKVDRLKAHTFPLTPAPQADL